MNRSMSTRKRILVTMAAMFMISQQAMAMPFTQGWYIERGRSNMKIGNYKAAIEAYEKAAEKDPDNREVMRNLGLAYEGQGLKDKAVAQYDEYLERFPDDPEIAFKQAEILGWSRYSYRRKDALKYYRMGLQRQDNTKMRIKYARLLAANRETSGEAIRQYEMVLARDSGNAEAHKGLAKAYAWNGENDRALYHSRKAEKTFGKSDGLGALERDLMKGREPMVGGRLLFLAQPSDSYDIKGFSTSLHGRHEITPFVTAFAEAGYENFWSRTLSANGAFISAGAQMRIDQDRRVDAELAYHGLAPISTSRATSSIAGSGSGDILGKIQYGQDYPTWSIRPGFKRERKMDSYLSLIGASIGGSFSGAARSNTFYTEFVFHPELFGEPLDLRITPYAGWVSTASLSPNEEFGTDFNLELPVSEGEVLSVSAGYIAQFAHYGTDQSGFADSAGEPLPGGYFSPQFFTNQNPRLILRYKASESTDLGLEGGPSLQYVKDSSLAGQWRLGTDARLEGGFRFTENLEWRQRLQYSRITDVFSRFQAETLLNYRF